MSLITDEQELIGAKGRFGYSIQTYDDGYGPLWILSESLGVTGIIRAQTWNDAYEIAEDEFFPSPDEGPEEWEKEYGADWSENACWQESYGFRPNSRNEPNGSFYQKDLNGERLEKLTPALLESLEITLEITLEISNRE